MQNVALGPERRSERSPWASRALRLLLQQVAEQYGLSSVVLADRAGQMWAAARLGPGDVEVAHSLAGLLPVTEDAGHCWVQRNGHNMLVKRVEVGETPLLLAGLGAEDATWLALRHAAFGIKRILGALVE
jgi:hypothetical protein